MTSIWKAERGAFQALKPLSRRAALQVGTCAALGITTADLLRAQALAEAAGAPAAKARSVIQINLGGGFTHLDSWDPKPEAPIEYRGQFGVVKTAQGDVFSEHFQKTAQLSQKLTVVRSVVGDVPDHGLATYHLFTGYPKTAVIDYPQMGAVVSHELGGRGEMPAYVAIPTNNAYGGSTGFLPSAYGAFELNADPGLQGFKRIQDFSIPQNIAQERFARRIALRKVVEQRLGETQADAVTLQTMGEFYNRANTLLTSASAQRAFSLEGESDQTFALYGHLMTGGGGAPAGLAGRLIMARRLVAAGVRFVTLNYGAWDNHTGLRKACTEQMPALDQGLAALIADLDDRGLLDSTLVMVTTEFGRTPKMNGDGRDHWSRVFSMVLAGGGVTRGQIYGASDATASEPARDAVPLEDFLCTIYHLLGIDSSRELLAFGTRPIEIIKDGKIVRGLLA